MAQYTGKAPFVNKGFDTEDETVSV